MKTEYVKFEKIIDKDGYRVSLQNGNSFAEISKWTHGDRYSLHITQEEFNKYVRYCLFSHELDAISAFLKQLNEDEK